MQRPKCCTPYLKSAYHKKCYKRVARERDPHKLLSLSSAQSSVGVWPFSYSKAEMNERYRASVEMVQLEWPVLCA